MDPSDIDPEVRAIAEHLGFEPVFEGASVIEGEVGGRPAQFGPMDGGGWLVGVLWAEQDLEHLDKRARKAANRAIRKHVRKATRQHRKIFADWVTPAERSFFDNYGGIESVEVDEYVLTVYSPSELPSPETVSSLLEHLGRLAHYLEQPLSP